MDVPVPLDQLTDRQMTRHHLLLLERQQATLDRLDAFMADLTASVSALQGAVDTMAQRFNAQNQVLTEALDEALAAADSSNTALADALAKAQAAAAQIDAEVAELNGIGAAPEEPVEDVPVEDLPSPPSEETPA